MMQPSEDRSGGDSLTIRDLMTVRLHQPLERHVRNTRTEAGVRSPLVVVTHPLVQNAPKMSFIQHDQPVETLATNRADQPLAERVRLWAAPVFSTIKPIANTAPSTAAEKMLSRS